MFGQLLFIRIRAAEKALREGRIDEAFRLVMAQDLRIHRRGQVVLEGLAERFLERAREHYRADRFAESLLDLDRADAGARETNPGVKDQIAELRKYVQTVAAETRRKDDSRRRRVDEAVRRIEDGSLAAGRKLLDQASDHDAVAARARESAERRAGEIADLVVQAERAMAADQFATAAQRLRRAKMIDAHMAEVLQLESKLCERVLSSVRSAIADGKLSRAADELACIGELGKTVPAVRELAGLLAQARESGDHLRGGRFAEARRCAMSIARQYPQAKWIDAVIQQVQQMEELYTALVAGPIGERLGNGGQSPRDISTPLNPPLVRGEGANPPLVRGEGVNPRLVRGEGRGSLEETIGLPRRGTATTQRLLLLVDGGGSFLLLRGGVASVGRAAAENPADVPLFSDVAERHANITRVDEDYFVFGNREIEVAGQKTMHTLLRDGDRLVLGKKAKFTFRLPSRRSATAVLELSDTTKMPHDVRRVILFERAATVGNGPTAHIPCRQAGAPLILFERDGELWTRRQSDGHVDTQAKALPIGESVEIGGVSMVLQHWPTALRA